MNNYWQSQNFFKSDSENKKCTLILFWISTVSPYLGKLNKVFVDFVFGFGVLYERKWKGRNFSSWQSSF
jgi:hypothetical protein